MRSEDLHNVLPLIGIERQRKFYVTARDIRRFAQAIGEFNPIHCDENYAAAGPYGTLVAPPLFFQCMVFDDVEPSRLPHDGSPVELDVPIPAKRAVGGGSEFLIHRLVRAGETITITSKLKDVSTKEGKSGRLYLIVVETTFTDELGKVVAVETATYIKRK